MKYNEKSQTHTVIITKTKSLYEAQLKELADVRSLL
jgi:hypothetical protein